MFPVFPAFPVFLGKKNRKKSGLVMGGPGLGWAGPARQIFRGWAATRPSSSQFQKFTARLGPAGPGPSHGSEAHETRALYGPAQPITWVGP